jgi:hypothetical protein
VTGFHPLDRARFLRDEHGADGRLVRLVANHSSWRRSSRCWRNRCWWTLSCTAT